jgi:cytochrome c peroxidase
VAVIGSTAWIGAYFTDTLCSIDTSAERPSIASTPLSPKVQPDIVRQGEMYFNDGRICFQAWQSCNSCHPGEGRVDTYNWDLLNDGIGNPKNTKSLLLAHQTPPTMSLGIRETAEVAVRSGIRFILFTKQPEAIPTSIDEYLKTRKPVPSPHLVNGKLSEKAQRGEKLFNRAGCFECHPPGLYTDLQSYDVGTTGKYDKPSEKFDTPTLVEIWRTGPYLHDGSALTVKDVITVHNPKDKHGKTSNLTPQEIDDLCEYLLSL